MGSIGQKMIEVTSNNEKVVMYGVTSCGLVMAHLSNHTAVSFHWPFMTNSTEYHDIFATKIREQNDSQVLSIEIYTNPPPSGYTFDGRTTFHQSYRDSAISIQRRYNVTTSYYNLDKDWSTFIGTVANGHYTFTFPLIVPTLIWTGG